MCKINFMGVAVKKDIENKPEVALLVLSGSIDESNLEEFKMVANPLMDDSSKRILALDVTALEYINSKVVGYLASLYTLGQVTNTKIVIVGENPNIMDILSLVGLTTLIEQKKSVGDL